MECTDTPVCARRDQPPPPMCSAPLVDPLHRFPLFLPPLPPESLQNFLPPFDQNSACGVFTLLDARVTGRPPRPAPCCVQGASSHRSAHPPRLARADVLSCSAGPSSAVLSLCCFPSADLPLGIGVLLGFTTRSALCSKPTSKVKPFPSLIFFPLSAIPRSKCLTRKCLKVSQT